jgi:Leucine Rich repeat
MVDALCANPNGCTLQSLSFFHEMTGENSDINMKKNIAKKFVTLLQQPGTVLKSLNLGYNKLGDEFVSVLANGLKKGSKLEELNLTNNCIGIEGAKKLADALYYNTTLVDLWLDENLMEDVGTNAITTALRYHPTLKGLGIYQIDLIEVELIETSQFLQYNEVLEAFFVDDVSPLLSILDYNDTLIGSSKVNHLDDEENIELVALLKQNKSGQRTAPKKGLRRRQQIYSWLGKDWISMHESKKIVNKSDRDDEDMPMVEAVHNDNNQDENGNDMKKRKLLY